MLQPASQRFYELLSFQMYGALKFARPRARLVYSEYCTYAPQTRYLEFDRVKKQMHKVHAPHRKSGYISGSNTRRPPTRTTSPTGSCSTSRARRHGPNSGLREEGRAVLLEIEFLAPSSRRPRGLGPSSRSSSHAG